MAKKASLDSRLAGFDYDPLYDVEEKPDVRCSGVFFRCRLNRFQSEPKKGPFALHRNESYRLLKRISCSHPECDACVQFKEDMDGVGVEDMIEFPTDPVDGKVYVLVYIDDGVSLDDTHHEWHWKLKLAPKGKQV